ncbi:MAG: Crp/Fnr family transcriptional regulator [Labilithrix sp.]|nr:Crp/Fnr family transcriptional regulator [Labilithrix sp.]
MSITQSLQALPLFQGIAEARLDQLVAALQPVKHAAGTSLFKVGDLATHFELLIEGTVTIEESPTTRFELRGVTPVGELGALTGIPRSTTATATTDVAMLSIPVGDLLGFFDANGDIGFAFYKNLLGLVSDKVRRDRRRLDEMRSNIIRTQKAMKQMRETVLAAPENETSKPLFETLDALIDNNRRANYRVTPPAGFASSVRLDSGRFARVLELSEGYLKVEGGAKDLTNDPSYWAGVLVMPTSEILVSGTVVREGEGAVVVKLDTLVDDFKAKLDDYMTRLQLLDYVV